MGGGGGGKEWSLGPGTTEGSFSGIDLPPRGQTPTPSAAIARAMVKAEGGSQCYKYL